MTLEPREPAFRIPDFAVELRVAEGGLETAVARQGHGFQRALLIAIVQQLASLRPVTPDDDAALDVTSPPALFLALEEPELYQHPAQARHFAATLASLADAEQVQVAYATHSEHFVDPSRYERLRRFRRQDSATWPTGEVTAATEAGVAARLAGVVPPNEVATRIRLTLRRQLAEAVFARAVLLVEGYSDAGFLNGIADRTGGFDVDGISVVFGMGKTQLVVPWAVLEELGIPTYLVMDGDRGRGQTSPEAEAIQAEVAAENRRIFAAIGAQLVDHPPTTVDEHWAVFEDDLESEASAWPGFAAELESRKLQLSDWRGKSEDSYRLAASSVDANPPVVMTSIVDAVRRLS